RKAVGRSDAGCSSCLFRCVDDLYVQCYAFDDVSGIWTMAHQERAHDGMNISDNVFGDNTQIRQGDSSEFRLDGPGSIQNNNTGSQISAVGFNASNAEHVSRSVDEYIKRRVANLSSIADDEALQTEVRNTMRRKAHDTFLWVSLVIGELDVASSWEVQHIVKELPESLKEIYRRMISKIQNHRQLIAEQCWLLLATAAHDNPVLSVIFSSDHGHVTSASVGGLVWSWDVRTGVLLSAFVETTNVTVIAFAPNGKRVATSGRILVNLWEVRNGMLLQTFKGSNCRVWSIIFSPDGEQLALTTYDAAASSGRWDSVHIYNIQRFSERDLEKHKTINGDFGRVWSAAFSPDCKTLATGSGDGMVRLWNPITGMFIRSLKGNTN
ncbi:hypothetical protein N5P37_007212, partial [Trichoderma harzianum]